MGKETDLLKAVKNNDKSKLQKLFLPEGNYKVGLQKLNSPSGRIRLRLQHINVDCHEPNTGNTPLILAVLNGYKDIADSLIFHAADVDATDCKGNTALHIAAFCDRTDFAEILLRNKAKVDVSNSDGNTPLHIACQNYSSNNVHLILKLLEAKADATILNKQGLSPLELAAMFNRKDAVSALLDHSPSLRENCQAMVEASIRGHAQIVELLLEYGCDPNGVHVGKQSGALHEAVRFFRKDVSKILLEFGADPGRLSGDLLSAEMIAKGLPYHKATEFLDLFKEYSNRPRRKPKYVEDFLNNEEGKQQNLKDYPLLPQCHDWTKNESDYCNSCTASNPNTNLLDGNLSTFWVIPSNNNAWTVFDFGCSHTLTGIGIWGWNSKQMAKDIELQKSKSLKGPWRTVATFVCEQKGSLSPNETGTLQEFRTFTDQSRYWRLLVVNNHGGNCICFQGVQFYGVDNRISEFLKKYELEEFSEDLIKKEYNTFDKFVTIPPDILRNMASAYGKVEELITELSHLRLLVFPFTRLAWLHSPITMATVDEIIPEFSVQADPEIMEKVELIISGSKVKGETIATLTPTGDKQPSVAIFSGISFLSAGQVNISVKSVRYPHIMIPEQHTVTVVSGLKSPQDIAAAFDDIETMLKEAQISLEPEEFSVPEIKWSS